MAVVWLAYVTQVGQASSSDISIQQSCVVQTIAWLARDTLTSSCWGSVYQLTYTWLIVPYRKSIIAYRKPKEAYCKPKVADRKPKVAYRKPRVAYRKPREAYRKPKEAYRKPKMASRKPKVTKRVADVCFATCVSTTLRRCCRHKSKENTSHASLYRVPSWVSTG